MRFDLDAVRAEREPIEVVFAGHTYTINGVTVLAFEEVQEGHLGAAVRSLFGRGKEAEKLLAAGFTIDDLRVLIEGLAGGQGNLAASTGS